MDDAVVAVVENEVGRGEEFDVFAIEDGVAAVAQCAAAVRGAKAVGGDGVLGAAGGDSDVANHKGFTGLDDVEVVIIFGG